MVIQAQPKQTRSLEVTFASARAMVQEGIYLRKFLANLPQAEPTCTIAWSEGPVGASDCAKHIDLRVHVS